MLLQRAELNESIYGTMTGTAYVHIFPCVPSVAVSGTLVG